jgi:protein tyrosine phosphatase
MTPVFFRKTDGTPVSITLRSKARIQDARGKGGAVKRQFQIHDASCTAVRHILHFQTEEWHDHASLSELALLSLLDILVEPMSSPEPFVMIVHCSAGIGRSGTFIIAYFIKKMMETAFNQNIRTLDFLTAPGSGGSGQSDMILELILALRRERPGMVQTWQQCRSLYHFANYLLDTLYKS